MANPSIYAAFERMWAHVINRIGQKADVVHNHLAATDSSDGFMTSVDKTKLNGIADGATAVTIREW